MSSIPNEIKILLVEDNPGDIRLTREALKEGRIQNELIVVRDGEEALDYLFRRGQYKDAVRPDLILLDLNLPKKNGQEVLAEIKNDGDISRIPVVVLTSSKSDQDVLKTYCSNHANCYIVKPVALDEFIRHDRDDQGFWFVIVKLPH